MNTHVPPLASLAQQNPKIVKNLSEQKHKHRPPLLAYGEVIETPGFIASNICSPTKRQLVLATSMEATTGAAAGCSRCARVGTNSAPTNRRPLVHGDVLEVCHRVLDAPKLVPLGMNYMAVDSVCRYSIWRCTYQ